MPNTETELEYRFIDQGDFEVEPGDFVIVDFPLRPREVVQVDTFEPVATFGSDDTSDLCSWIQDEMDRQGYYPNVWYQNERGAIDLCVIVPTDG